MLKEIAQSSIDRNADAIQPSQRRYSPRLIVVDKRNGQDEAADSEEEVLPRQHQHSMVEAELSSEVDHGEEVVEFEVSENDLADLFSCPYIDSITASPDERDEKDSMPDEFYAWDAAKSYYKSVSHDILPSHFSISEEGKLGKVPVPDLFTTGGIQSESKSSPGVFKWLHLQNTNMSFEAFREFAIQAEALESSDREQLKRLLIKVYSTYDSGSQDCRYMNPGVEAFCKARADSPLNSKSMAWSCLPYLRSEKPTISTGAGDLSKHPPWGLLQWHYNDYDNRRNLDLDQTICRFTKSADNVVQIDQLWCITIDQALILTSARCSAETLIGGNSSLRSIDCDAMATQGGTYNCGLLVHDSGNRIWSFDVGECGTWLEFVARFRTITESFDDNYAVFENKTIIRPQDWADVHSRAMYSPVHLKVVKRSSQSNLDSPVDMSARLDEMAKSNLALLVYTKGEKDAKQPQSNSLQCAEALVETLQAEAKSPQSNFFKAITELKCSILSSARVIAGFFLPPSDDSLLSQRYWSVITAILEADYDECTIDLESLTTHLKRLSKTATSYQKLFHPSLTPAPMDLDLPVELGLVWVLLLKGLITAGKFRYSTYQVAETFRRCNALLKSARSKMLQLSPHDLAHAEIVLPLGLSGIVMNTLVQDVGTGSQGDLVSTYSQYSDALELDILKSRGDPASQIKVLEDLQKAYGTSPGGSAAKAIGVHSPETGLESRLLYRARRTAQARYKQWTALMKQFDDLKTENERMVIMKKDTRETASIIFTIVSTIFLPLTTVASVLGMSTSDIRDMRQGQWIFWITGLPLAIITAFLCVAAVDRHLISMTFSWLGGHFGHGDERWRRRLSRHAPKPPGTGQGPDTPKVIKSSSRGDAVDVDVELGAHGLTPHTRRRGRGT
ncbi:hypothetical protein EG328_010068 [Venturia inaequalis]|uniref:Uncharacterized protein n=1 Tax=Venturia inaequalis TaxID=5025 RepID=A0A8H3U7V1_VENIN|nr:hypothetical protein EG328_010068 [Venturia inaequalis]